MRLTKILAVLAAFACCNASIAQNLTVKGKVINEATQKPLQAASVTISGSKKGVATDAQGNFTIKLPEDKEYQLTIVFTGFATKKISAKAGDNITVTLKEEIKDEGEVIVQTGYGGGVKKKEVVASLSTVGAKDLKDIPITSVGEALNGRLAGVTATAAEGSPDAEISIKVRGGGSITGDNSPLYVIDGVIVENGLSNIALQDVQDITVLKDAAATAIYGARGANGVLIITTKSGKSGKLRVTYNTYVGFKKLPKTLAVLNPYDFVISQYERAILNSADLTSFRTNYGSTWDTLENYTQATPVNWQKEVMGLNGFSQQHNVGLSGGSKKTTFLGSYTYQDDKAIVINSKFVKHLINFKVEHKINDKLKVSGGIRYTNQNVYGAGTSDANSTSFNRLRQSIKYRPYVRPGENPDDVNIPPDNPGNGLLLINPIKLANNEYRRQTTNNLNLTFSATYNVAKNITFKTSLGYETSMYQDRQFSDSLTPYSTIQNGKNPILEFDSTKKENFTNSNVLTYTLRNFHRKHDIDILLGEETNDLKTTKNTHLYRNIPNGLGAEASINSSLKDTIEAAGYPNAYNSRATLVGFFGQIKYSFEKKYLFSFIMRADGSSKFAPEQRWGYFPSASFGWRISNEKFFEKIKFIDDLKFRASYGANGNARIDDYLYLNTFLNSAYYYGIGNQVVKAYTSTALPNEKLKWEALVSQNVGLDITILKKRLEINVDYYTNHSSDLLLVVPVANTYGYATQQQNIGKTTNKGFEIQVNASIIQKRNGFNWNANFNISFNKNEITQLGRNMQYFSPAASWGVSGQATDYIEQIGQPVGSMYGLVTDGFYTTNDFLPYDFTGSHPHFPLKPGVAKISSGLIPDYNVQPGSIKFKDLNGDGVVDLDHDRKIIGNPTPKFTGGLNQQFSYKNFDASVFVNFSYGGQIYNANKIENTNNYTVNANLLGVMADRWKTIDNSGNLITDLNQLAALNTNAKIWTPTRFGTDFLTHSWAIEDGSFIRINNVTFGYSMPIKSLAKLHISRLRIYVTGNNLAVFTKYTGYDPEVSVRKSPLTPALDYSAYPKSRSIIFGINVGF